MYYKVTQHSYQLIDTLNFLVGNIKFICENLKECKKNSIKSITKSERKFAPTFIHTNLLPDVKFNGYCNKYDS